MSMNTIIDAIAKEFNLNREVLLSKNRTDKVSKIRFILYKTLHLNGYTTTQIGIKLNRDHATVCKGIQ